MLYREREVPTSGIDFQGSSIKKKQIQFRRAFPVFLRTTGPTPEKSSSQLVGLKR
jgi:hypothetical protein